MQSGRVGGDGLRRAVHLQVPHHRRDGVAFVRLHQGGESPHLLDDMAERGSTVGRHQGRPDTLSGERRPEEHLSDVRDGVDESEDPRGVRDHRSRLADDPGAGRGRLGASCTLPDRVPERIRLRVRCRDHDSLREGREAQVHEEEHLRAAGTGVVEGGHSGSVQDQHDQCER